MLRNPKADGEYAHQEMPPDEVSRDQCQYDDADGCEILA